MRGYVAQRTHFEDTDAKALAARPGGKISKFQSINSEDAVTYSWFGTLDAATVEARRSVVQWLYDRAGIRAAANAPTIDQWVRVFHPNAADSPRGPELDARIDDPSVALVYVEAKWNVKVGTGKGKAANVPDDQIVLRRDQSDRRVMAVLGSSERKPDLTRWHEPDGNPGPVRVAWLTWDELAECSEHPLFNEFARSRLEKAARRLNRRGG